MGIFVKFLVHVQDQLVIQNERQIVAQYAIWQISSHITNMLFLHAKHSTILLQFEITLIYRHGYTGRAVLGTAYFYLTNVNKHANIEMST